MLKIEFLICSQGMITILFEPVLYFLLFVFFPNCDPLLTSPVTGFTSNEVCTANAGLQIRLENYFLQFSPKTYVMGTPNNRLNETALLSTQNTCLN